MPGIPNGSFGRYQPYLCPACHTTVTGRKKRLGPYNVHPHCTVDCPLCDKEVTEPPLGRMSDIESWCGQPAHTACKKEATP